MDEPLPVVITIHNRHGPHKIGFLILALATGLAYMFGAPKPGSVAAAMHPHQLVEIWAVGLALHGAAGLAAVLVPGRELERSLLLELGSMLIGIGALAFLAVAAFAFAHWGALFGGGLAAVWAVANVVRARQCWSDLRKLQKKAPVAE